MGVIDCVYLIHCTYKFPAHMRRGAYANMCFKTEKEATAFCKYHGDEHQFMTWEKIAVGNFNFRLRKKKAKPRLKKRVKRKS